MLRIAGIWGLVATALFGFHMNPDLSWGTKVIVWLVCGFIAYYLRGWLKKDTKENPEDFKWLTWNKADFLIILGLLIIVVIAPLTILAIGESQKNAESFWLYHVLPTAAPFIVLFIYAIIYYIVDFIKGKIKRS